MIQTFHLHSIQSKLAYQYRAGTKTPIVIIHGIGGSSIEEYAPLLSRADLAEHPIVLLDLIGYGHSDKPIDFDYSLSAQCRAIDALLGSLSLPPAIVLGHSLGGSLAILLAKQFPERVCGLIMAEAGLEFKYLVLSRWAARYKEDVFTSQFHALLAGGDGGILGSFSTQPTLKMTSAIAFYRTSVSLVAHGKGDALLQDFYDSHLWKTFWVGEKTRERYGDVFLQELKRRNIPSSLIRGAGHQLVLEAPDAFGEALADAIGMNPVWPGISAR
jgi:pimeloyl-ACP methyl ester carboxylesterase